MDSQTIDFICVRPLEEHARQIMIWRNDPETLRMSYHMQPKVWEKFYPEFLAEYFAFPELPPLFAFYQGQKVAFLRFRPVANPENSQRRCCDVSINVAPAFRGRGLGQRCLMEVKSWLIKQGYDDIYAEIKPGNIASIKAFELAGFVKLEDGVKILIDSGEQIAIHRYLAPLAPANKARKRVYIIAEAGSNWRMGTARRDLAMAKELVSRAAEAGADAIKFQTYRPETTYVVNAGKSDYLAEAGIEEDIQEVFFRSCDAIRND